MGKTDENITTATQNQIKSAVLPILKKYGVLKSALFGSYASGEQDRKSDVDILVKLPRGSSLFELVDLRDELKNKLKREVDVVTYDSVHPRLKRSIFATCKTIL